MPYEVALRRKIDAADPDRYINPCCFGGDVVSDRLLPAVRNTYSSIQAEQEDWGWFIWFRKGDVRLAVDIFCDDPETGDFRIRLTSRRRRMIFFDREVDTAELEDLRALVVRELDAWTGTPCEVRKISPEG